MPGWGKVVSVVLAALCTWMAGCKIEPRPVPGSPASDAQAGAAGAPAFDAKAAVDAMWDSKVIPAVAAMATDFSALKKAMQTPSEAALAAHGHRENGEGAPWNLAASATGRVLAVDTTVGAGTADIDVDGDGRADLQIQIGPVLRGSALRDSLPFVSFTAYSNQIDFAQLANALNDRAYATTLQGVDRATLAGRRVSLVGVFTVDPAADLPLLTVTAFQVLKP